MVLSSVVILELFILYQLTGFLLKYNLTVAGSHVPLILITTSIKIWNVKLGTLQEGDH